jgi:hypothetical protein
MPEFDRFELERQLAKVLSKDLRDELAKLLDYLGDPPNLLNVPDLYWKTGWKLIQKHVEPFLVTFFIEQALESMAEYAIEIDLAELNTDAAEWARNNSDEWLQQTFNRTYEGVGPLVADAYEQGWTTKELAKALERYYSPVRAEMIAITELTRAQVEAEREMERKYFEMFGTHLVPIWKTANDERVCKRCGPRHDLPIVDDVFPPAHPRCRCKLSHKTEDRLTPKQKAIWQSR